eukprot:CAMPEP_0201691054 /NCGR_PEP_ID=MMETSP0578-20130828/4317_1 /ASSEMBLY_ACC=CAM_ASM_000663 /TAXON_ID=267565 /ORGANISM="Skeletonema grethea, Strain CCMP 1804" /LENGTH=386 /DNA_ID=CAMNT_0048176177 /DNA_START=84 /DNA_END=1244 /DNA_ORIENTATION=-
MTTKCDVPSGGADGADAFVESPKLVQVEAETRPDFKELKKIEKKRREILLRAELPFWRIIMFWSGTCLKEIAADSLVWLTIIIYVGIRIYANHIDFVPDSVEMLSKTNIGILGGFLSFFLVLFVNQTNGRFLEMYGFSKACSGRIQDIAGVARTQLPPEVGQKLVRHFNAAHVAGYVGLNAIGMGSPYSKTFFFDHYNADNKLVTPLLTPEELKVLSHHDMDHSGLCMKELVTWCQMDVAQARKDGYLDSYQEKFMHSKILDFRAAMDGMYDYTDQPPHFFYIHFLVLLSALYLPLFAIDTAYAGGWGAEKAIGLDILQGIIVFLQCIFVVGLRSLGTKMIDPYGDDLEDLSVINYVEGTLEICATIMGAKQPANKEVSGVTTGLL